MNIIKMSACILSLMSVGFSMNYDDSAPNTPVHQNHTHGETPVSVLAALNIVTPPHNPQQFFTPQNQMIQHVTPGAPVAPAYAPLNVDVTPMHESSGINRLAGSVISSPPLTQKRKFDETICGPKGDVLFTTSKKGKGSENVGGRASPTDVATGMTQLETAMFTPEVRFNTGKNMQWMTAVDPVTEDVRNEYVSEVEDDSVNVSVNDDVNNISDVQELSLGSFVLHGVDLVNNSANSSAENDGSFVIHGANLGNMSVNNSFAEEGDVSVISSGSFLMIGKLRQDRHNPSYLTE